LVRIFFLQRRLVDAVHHHEQLVERQRAPRAAHARDHELIDRALHAPDHRRVGRAARFGAQLEHPLAPGARLDHQVAVGRQRAGGPEEQVVVDREALVGGESWLQRLAAQPDRVDLVDEHDALAAPLRGQLLGLARQVAHEDRVDADERPGEARARHRDERAVE